MACCGGKELDINGEISTNTIGGANGKEISFKDKVNLVIQIQKIWRGYITRKKFRQFREDQGFSPGAGMMGLYGQSPDGPTNYDNPDVIVS
jgi:hypothetical protein